jgi:hypothetical protein
VLLGTGLGGFGPRTDFPTGSGPVSVAIGDVNHDGRSDLVVADSASNTVSELLGNGAGGFGPRTVHATGARPMAAAVGELSGDGRLDLCVAHHDAGSVSIRRGRVPTTTALVAGPNPALSGSALALTATVSVPAPGQGVPADSVRFFDGPMLLGTAPVIGGVASLAPSAAHLGDRTLTAIHKGDGVLFGSVTAKRKLRVVASAEPVIFQIADVANDQGGSVTLRFAASPYDFVGAGTPITHYDVYRAMPVPGPAPAPARMDAPAPRPRSASALGTDPEGWIAVGTVPATVAPEYEVAAPTLADSNGSGPNRATFMVRAWTSSPALFHDSAPDSGSSRDNLPPAMPESFDGSHWGGAAHLSWASNDEPDLCCYRLHRGPTADFTPDPGNQIAAPSDTSYVDPAPAGSFYKLAAEDVNGNLSAYVVVSPGVQLDVPVIAPATLALERIQPNPSRGPGWLVRFSLPAAAPARLELLDVSGRRVMERAVGALGPGRHTLAFTANRSLAAGIYLIRLSQGTSVRTTRVALLR